MCRCAVFNPKTRDILFVMIYKYTEASNSVLKMEDCVNEITKESAYRKEMLGEILCVNKNTVVCVEPAAHVCVWPNSEIPV